jgi:putative ABC transport system permease protein
MSLGPILSQLRRNKLGAFLIAAQTAITLALLSNAVFIVHGRVALMQRPSGADERDLFVIRNRWLHDADDGLARLESDLATLRALPGVADAYASNTYPLSNSGSSLSLYLSASQTHPTAQAALYLGDDHALGTLGLRLIAGRNFSADQLGATADSQVASVIITRDLAEKLYPGGGAVGRPVYLDASHLVTIIGVVQTLMVPWTGDLPFSQSSMIWPLKVVAPNPVYIVRARPGRLAGVMAAVPDALYTLDRARILAPPQSMADVRQDGYRVHRAFATMLVVVCGVMLAITACGIVGLTSYWVAQRRRQIGIRRALGGTRSAIVGHFQTENLVIAVAGTLAGAALGVGMNLWAVQALESARMPAAYVIIGMLVLLALGQLAALWPALRAATVPPALAARNL